MAERSTIEWTDSSWNPGRGCRKISAGCKHCYAETFAERFRNVPGHPYERGFDPRVVEGALDLPVQWRCGRRIFVNSMSDLFLEDFSHFFIGEVFGVMRATPQHQFQVLTKRAQRMRDLLAGRHMPEHVWLGVSVEDSTQLGRVDLLRQVDVSVRFLSLEPLLGPMPALDLAGVKWVIVGGESGARARSMNPAWVRDIRDQCREARVPFFFKQWGGLRKKAAGRTLDGRTWDEFPAAASKVRLPLATIGG